MQRWRPRWNRYTSVSTTRLGQYLDISSGLGMRFLALYTNQESRLLNRRVNCSLTVSSLSCGAIQTQASLRNHDVVIELGNLGMKLEITC